MNFEYREISTSNVDRDAYISLHNDLFRTANIDYDWMDWYHERLPVVRGSKNKTRTFGVLDKDRLIGIWSVEEIVMNDGIKSYRVGRCFAVGIHSDYRRMGLFVSLSTYALSELRKSKDFEFLIGFPQKGRSVTPGHLKAGWKMLGDVHLMSKKIERYPIRGVNLSSVNNLLNSIASNDYLNARFLSHPYCNYSYLTHGEGLLILKSYADFIQVVYSSGDSNELEFLYRSLERLTFRHGQKEIITWSNPLSKSHSELEKLGFENGSDKNVSVDIIYFPITSFALPNLEGINFHMSIEEGY